MIRGKMGQNLLSLWKQLFYEMFLPIDLLGPKETVLLSQAAACDGMIYSVNYNGQNSVTQGYALPLIED